MATPNITLTATLLDYSGNEIGSTTQPAYLRVALCGFGPTLPVVPGTASIGKVSSWFVDVPYTGVPLSGASAVKLWGNDQITPSGTYYAISVLDAQRNVLQTGIYRFTGGPLTVDLSSAAQIVAPVPPQVGGYLAVTASGTLALSTSGWVYNMTFDITLAGNVTSASLSGLVEGQFVQFLIRQQSSGGKTFAWPSNVKNPALINSAPNSVSSSNYVVDVNGNLYPAVGWS